MEFVYNIRNFDVDARLIELFETKLHALKRLTGTYGHFEKNGDILIEKLPKGQYLARVFLHLPHHQIHAQEKGFTPEQALHEAADNAKAQILKSKVAYHPRELI